MKLKRVMLAAKLEDLNQVKFPVIASPKLDGIRAVNVGGKLLSRTMKYIPNEFCQELFGREEYHGLDGELIVGSPTDKNCMQHTSSGVMTYSGQPNVTWHVFDYWDSPDLFKDRISTTIYKGLNKNSISVLSQSIIPNIKALLDYEYYVLSLGYEGVIFRDPNARYKQGRSTFREGGMVKLKRFIDSEAVVTGIFEMEHNDNEATYDERGYTKRSSAQEGKVSANTLGGFYVRDIYSGTEFNIGSGFSAAQRDRYWQEAEATLGKIVKYKYFPQGVLDKPRHPIFLGFRDPIDIGEGRV